MNDIKEIYKMLDWNQDENTQLKGIECANKMDDIAAFIQPIVPNYSKNIWDNCAKILCLKTDDELMPYLRTLFEWMQDMNWPGAFTICDRINAFKNKKAVDAVKAECERIADETDDLVWLKNLALIN